MTRLDPTRSAVFVGGPFNHALSADGVFDPSLRALIEGVIAALERAGFEVISSHVSEDFGRIEVDGPPEFVVRRDFDWMKRCAAYVFLLPNRSDGSSSYRSDGSCIELGWASALQKPTVIVRDLAMSFTDLIVGLGELTWVEHLSAPSVAADASLLVRAVEGLLSARA